MKRMFERMLGRNQVETTEKDLRDIFLKPEPRLNVSSPLIEEFRARSSHSTPPHTHEKSQTIGSPDEAVLSSHERESGSELRGSASKNIELVKLKDDGSGIFKPKDGEYVGDSLEKGTGYKRERAAYLIDLFLGFDLVPPTIIREIKGKIGSFQRFIADAELGRLHQPVSEPTHAYRRQKLRMQLLDFIIKNEDRHGANYLVKAGKIYAIDHGISFHKTFGRPYGFGDFKGLELPQDIGSRLQELLTSENTKTLFMDLMSELLSTEEVVAVLARLEKVRDLYAAGPVVTEDAHDILEVTPNIINQPLQVP